MEERAAARSRRDAKRARRNAHRRMAGRCVRGFRQTEMTSTAASAALGRFLKGKATLMNIPIRNKLTAGLPGVFLLAGLCACFPAAAAEDDVSWIADQRGCKVANTFPRPGETITWSGPCKNGYADGDGVMQWFLDGKEDDRYEGHV